MGKVSTSGLPQTLCDCFHQAPHGSLCLGGVLGESEGFQGKAWGLGVTGLVSNADVQRSVSSRSLSKRSWAVPETRLNICQAKKTKEGLYSLKSFLRPGRRHPSCLARLPSDTGVRGGRAAGPNLTPGAQSKDRAQTENSGRATLRQCHSLPRARRPRVRISTEPFALHVRAIDPQDLVVLPSSLLPAGHKWAKRRQRRSRPPSWLGAQGLRGTPALRR